MKDKKDVNNINPYEVDKLSKIPSWLIVILLKYWAAAAAVYFSLIGGMELGLDFSQWEDSTDLALRFSQDITVIIVLAFALAIVLNYICKPIIRLMYNRRNNTYKFNMINSKGIVFFFITMLYTLLLSTILYIVTLFLSANGLVLDLFGTTANTGIEPFTYALCFIIIDGIFILAKNGIQLLIKKHRYKKQIQEL
jgi:hypothetical protein